MSQGGRGVCTRQSIKKRERVGEKKERGRQREREGTWSSLPYLTHELISCSPCLAASQKQQVILEHTVCVCPSVCGVYVQVCEGVRANVQSTRPSVRLSVCLSDDSVSLSKCVCVCVRVHAHAHFLHSMCGCMFVCSSSRETGSAARGAGAVHRRVDLATPLFSSAPQKPSLLPCLFLSLLPSP